MRLMTRPDVRPHRPAIEIAEILRRHGDAFRRDQAGHLGRVERRVMSAIVACRTEALGGHVEACNDCGMTRIPYNSCRNRHCPKCQGRARAAWLAAREADLLAHSRDGDQVFQAMVITDSSDRDQVRRRTRLTGLSVLEMVSSSGLAGWFGDRPGGPWEGPVRG